MAALLLACCSAVSFAEERQQQLPQGAIHPWHDITEACVLGRKQLAERAMQDDDLVTGYAQLAMTRCFLRRDELSLANDSANRARQIALDLGDQALEAYANYFLATNRWIADDPEGARDLFRILHRQTATPFADQRLWHFVRITLFHIEVEEFDDLVVAVGYAKEGLARRDGSSASCRIVRSVGYTLARYDFPVAASGYLDDARTCMVTTGETSSSLLAVLNSLILLTNLRKQLIAHDIGDLDLDELDRAFEAETKRVRKDDKENLSVANDYHGTAMLEAGRVDRAITLFQASLDVRSTTPETPIQLANAYVKTGAYDKAEQLLDGVEHHAENSGPQVMFKWLSAKATLATARGQDATALRYHERARTVFGQKLAAQRIALLALTNDPSVVDGLSGDLKQLSKSLDDSFGATTTTRDALKGSLIQGSIALAMVAGWVLYQRQKTQRSIRQLAQKLDRQQATKASENTRLAGLVHDLNNPLTVIISALEMLEIPHDMDASDELRLAKSGTRDVKEIADELMDLALAIRQRESEATEISNVAKLVESEVERWKLVARKKQIELVDQILPVIKKLKDGADLLQACSTG